MAFKIKIKFFYFNFKILNELDAIKKDYLPFSLFWRQWQDSKHRSLDYLSGVLPLYYLGETVLLVTSTNILSKTKY